MKVRNLIILILLIIPLGAVAFAQGYDTPSDWEVIGNGIEFHQYHLSDPVPVNIFVTRMDRINPNVIIESSIAQGRLSGGIESVSKMADRYDQALNYWGPTTIPVSQTWGSRNDVIVAINGFYYGGTEEPPGVPWSGQIHSGWYAKRYNDLESLSGFVWKMDRSVFIGECITHPLDKQVIYIVDGDDQHTLELDGLNRTRSDDELILFTPQYDTNTGTNANGIEVLIEMEEPTSISLSSDAPQGIIREIRDHQGSTPIPFDHVVLSAHGIIASELRTIVSVDNRIAIAQRVKDCVISPTHDWNYAYAGVGGQFHFLRDGVIFDYSDKGEANVRDPRTATAYNDEYIFFIVADGRDPGVSEGINIANLAAFARNILGATNGIAQDGGGSSTMVINGRLVNQPFNPEWCKFAFLPFVLNGGIPTTQGSQIQPNIPAPIPLEPTPDSNEIIDSAESEENIQADYPHVVCERPVANGMMMVVVEPMAQSDTFSPGNLIATTSETNLHLGPGTNYGVLTSISSGSIGEVTAHTKELDGILAKNSYWWQVEIGDKIGWVQEESLVVQLKSAPAVWSKDASQIR